MKVTVSGVDPYKMPNVDEFIDAALRSNFVSGKYYLTVVNGWVSTLDGTVAHKGYIATFKPARTNRFDIGHCLSKGSVHIRRA